MTTSQPTPVPPPDSATGDHLDRLDELIGSIRRVLQRPGYRRRLLEGLSHRIDLGVLRLLRIVQRAPDDPTIGEVADRLVVDPSTASRVVDRAVAEGYLERRACDTDRRRARLRLTATGTAVLGEVTDRRRELLREVTDGWESDRLEQLVALLERLAEGFETLERSP